jgi:hypothetical protein
MLHALDSLRHASSSSSSSSSSSAAALTLSDNTSSIAQLALRTAAEAMRRENLSGARRSLLAVAAVAPRLPAVWKWCVCRRI